MLGQPQSPSCPIDEYGLRDYYRREIARITKAITDVDKRLAADELARDPDKANCPEWRRQRTTKPARILSLLGHGCFWIPPHPLHHRDKGSRDHWVATILNRPGWTGDWWARSDKGIRNAHGQPSP